MKKYLFFLLTLVVASFAFISCSSDDDSDNGDYDKSMIVGTWEMTAVKMSESGTYIDWPFNKTYAHSMLTVLITALDISELVEEHGL